MAKRLMAKTGTYQNQQGENKGEYAKIGVILSNDNGEYMLLDPSVSLAGVLVKQNALAAKEGKPMRDNIMASIFEDQPAQHAPQQAAPQQYSQAPQQAAPAYQQQPAPQQAPASYGDDQRPAYNQNQQR